MTESMAASNLAPEAQRVVSDLDKRVSGTGTDGSPPIIKIRISQINGCAFCVDTHTRDARKQGKTEARI